MEVWPLDSVPLTLKQEPTKRREWPGTLVAEWVDSGLSEMQERQLRESPQIFALMVLAGLVLIITGRPGVFMVAWIGFFGALAVYNYLSLRRSRKADRITLTLEPECLRVTRRSSKAIETRDLPRSETGLLIRSVLGRRSRHAETLRLQDKAGVARLVLPDRLVRILSTPFGTDAAALGLDPKGTRLALLVGSWWPDPNNRATQLQPPKQGLWDATERPWGQRDLDLSKPLGPARVKLTGLRSVQRRLSAILKRNG
jgi:hypothetical protein